MKSSTYFLAMGASRWQAVRVTDGAAEVRDVPATTLASDESGRPLGQEVAAVLRELGWHGEDVCAGLGSPLALAAQIDLANLPRKGRETAMLYRLEEQLPLEAERLTADFLPPSGGRTLGVAVETARVAPLIEQLTEGGIEVAGLCPTALLAAWQALSGLGQTQALAGSTWHYLLVADADGFDLLRLADGRPVGWHTTALDGKELTRSLNADLLTSPVEAERPVIAVLGDLDAEVLKCLETDCSADLVRPSEDLPVVLAARAAAALLAGKPAGWIDLRRDNLAPANAWGRLAPLVRTAAALVILLLAAVTGLSYVRGLRYEAQARQFEAQELAQYQALYPRGQAPPSIASRLRSEYSRLAAVSGDGTAVPLQKSALESLRSLVANLPGDVRCRITNIEIGPGAVLVEGQAKSHSDAEKIAQALKRADLDVEPPATEQLQHGGGVSFTLNAKSTGTKTATPAAGGRRP